ncbi:hypothetical protein [Streptomyces platensis]|nr:hypothetical protein [Streptomyces platensis]MCF3142197.1 hypothetical protein [Streptomyces platensis]
MARRPCSCPAVDARAGPGYEVRGEARRRNIPFVSMRDINVMEELAVC